jgi:DNA-binding beta-propeller fold protein YncE
VNPSRTAPSGGSSILLTPTLRIRRPFMHVRDPEILVRIARTVLLTALVATALPTARAAAQVDGLTGTIIVTNKNIASATMIDVSTGRALVTFPTGQGPHEIALSDNGTIAVVTDYGGSPGNTLTVIEVAGRRVVRTIDLGQYRRPHGIRFFAGDTLIVVTSEASRNVVFVNVAAGEVRKAIETTQNGSHMLGLVADRSRIYTGNIGSNTVSELNVATGELVRTFDVPAQPEAINVTPDGREVWVGSNATGKVSVVDPRSGTVKTVAEGFAWPYRVAYTPDLKTALIPDLGNEVLRFFDRASLRELGRIEFTGGGPQGITITPDGKYAFLSMSKQARVAIIDIAARKVAGYLPAAETPDGVVYTTRTFPRPD